jgi:CheY-like chemotaxis protein
MNILVVDDERTLANLMSEFLREQGHHVEVAYHGNEALAHCADIRFEVAVVDIFMPIKDGLELIRLMKKNYPDIGIVAISGMQQLEVDYLNTARLFGAQATLEKPFAFQTLLDEVQRVATAGQ